MLFLFLASEYLQNREIALILGDDTHLRYKVFMTEADFRKDLVRIKPHKIDIGAVYNHRVCLNFYFN